MKQTAVEWLVEQIKKDSNVRLRGLDLDEIGNQAKEMEKQQIIDAYADGRISVIKHQIISYEDYYNETFKNK
jgi:hypothetical protein